MFRLIYFFSAALLFALFLQPANAQYFGQNLVRYKNLDFRVKQSEHFDLYYYTENEKSIENFIVEAETWYNLHKKIFGFDLPNRNPIILYDNHSDFQSTTVIRGGVGVGTGGVTEGLRNRVIMPFFSLRHQTRHVLGHELVHAFQYKTIFEKENLSFKALENIPLWMTEGLAEYLSVGKVDPHTAMWMRDAVINDDIPTLKQLSRGYKYFPYRYGQAFWAFVGSFYGDSIIYPFYVETAKRGLEHSIQRTFGYTQKALSNIWAGALKKYYSKFKKHEKEKKIGKTLIDSVNGGAINVAPSISPDGKKLVYFSTRDLLSIDLFVSDIDNLKKTKKISSKIINNHIDEFNFLESSGTWSPNGELFAISAFSKGRQILVLIDVKSGKNFANIILPNLDQFSNLSWSPDGEKIAFTGFKNTQSDIYMYLLEEDRLIQLTDDEFSDYQPNFSPDNKTIVFSTDRENYGLGNNKLAITYSLALLDIETKEIKGLNIFNGANNLDAHFSGDGNSIFFLSNRDGFRNIYKYSLVDNKVFQITDFFTGVSGISEYAPAISVSKNDDLIYTYYGNRVYSLHKAGPEDFLNIEVSPDDINFDAAILPFAEIEGKNVLHTYLNQFDKEIKKEKIETLDLPYRPKFGLTSLSPSGSFGVGYSSAYSLGLSGAIFATFSDIIGVHNIDAVLSLQGDIYSAGLLGAYTNKRKRSNWSVIGGHLSTPSVFAFSQLERNTNGDTFINNKLDQIWTLQEVLGGSFNYPFSKRLRWELNLIASYFSYVIFSYNNYYNNAGFFIGGNRIRRSNEEFNEEFSRNYSPLYASLYNNFNSAFTTELGSYLVGDNSVFGITSPLDGYRFRVGFGSSFGNFNYTNIVGDFRFYKRIKPISLAFRAMSLNRISFGTNDKYYNPIFLGNPSLVRGYASYLSANDFNNLNSAQNLVGTNIALFNFEVRLPFTGIKKFSAFESKFLYSDLNFFVDAGVAWLEGQDISFGSYDKDNTVNTNGEVRIKYPVVSAGVSLRIIFFGQAILEPFYAFIIKDAVLDQTGASKEGRFGLNIVPGW